MDTDKVVPIVDPMGQGVCHRSLLRFHIRRDDTPDFVWHGETAFSSTHDRVCVWCYWGYSVLDHFGRDHLPDGLSVELCPFLM